MLFGAGQLIFVTKDLAENDSIRGENLLYPPLLATFEMTPEVNNLEARALIAGKRQIVAAAIAEETWTLNTTAEYADWQSFQFMYDELAQVSSNIRLPIVKSRVIPDTLSFVDNDVSADDITNGDVLVYKSSRGTNGRAFMKVVTAAPAAFDEVQVTNDGTDTTFTFFAGMATQRVQYLGYKTYSSIQTIGEEADFDEWGRLEFWGRCYGTEFPGQMLLRVMDLSRISIPTISVTGEISEIQVEFRASVPAGERKPYKLYELSTGIEVT